VEKKTVGKYQELVEQYPEAYVEVWCEDECRIGLKPVVKKVLSPIGIRPVAYQVIKYEWLYVYGFVHPASGNTEWALAPDVNLPRFESVLEDFAKTIKANKYYRILLIIDNASWHTSKKLKIPEGIHLHFLPPATPELQPAERLWPVVKEEIANIAIYSIDLIWKKIENRCCSISTQLAFICSLTLYRWWFMK
jgi:transposase